MDIIRAETVGFLNFGNIIVHTSAFRNIIRLGDTPKGVAFFYFNAYTLFIKIGVAESLVASSSEDKNKHDKKRKCGNGKTNMLLNKSFQNLHVETSDSNNRSL